MEPHPYRQAFEAQDLDRVLPLLADDAVFHSGMTNEPGFEGRGSAAAILAITLEVFKGTEYTHELGDERSHVLVGDAVVLGKPVKITWFLELDAEGKVREIWLLARPLTGLVAIIEAVGQAAERAGGGSEVRELTEALPAPAAELESAAARVIAGLNRSTASQPAA